MDRLPGGLWPVMLTPFKFNGEIDFKGLEELTDFYLISGASGLFANCLSSEMYQLTSREKILITEKVVKWVNGKVPVVATGTFGGGLTRTIEFIKTIEDTGVDTVVLNTNQIVPADATDMEFQETLNAILHGTGKIPLGVYECPVPYKRLIKYDLMSWLGKSGRIYYHKDTSCNLKQIREKIKAIHGTPLGLYNANTATALQSLKDGAQGLSPVGANYFPEFYQFLIENYEKDDLLLHKLNSFLTITDSLVDGTQYPLLAKIFLANRGLSIQPFCRMQLPAIDQQDYIKLERLMSGFLALGEEAEISLESLK